MLPQLAQFCCPMVLSRLKPDTGRSWNLVQWGSRLENGLSHSAVQQDYLHWRQTDGASFSSILSFSSSVTPMHSPWYNSLHCIGCRQTQKILLLLVEMGFSVSLLFAWQSARGQPYLPHTCNKNTVCSSMVNCDPYGIATPSTLSQNMNSLQDSFSALLSPLQCLSKI